MNDTTFEARLNEALSRKGVSQADLAQELGVSAASVSSWCGGSKRPSTPNLERIAEFLGVTPGFLQFGEGTSPPIADAEIETLRSEYREELVWYWRPAPRDRGREYGNPAAYAFETDIGTLARESGQNISDEKLPTGPSVEARYTVSEISGSHLAGFLEAIRFSDVRPHLEAARAMDTKAGTTIGRGLGQLDEGRLVLIRVEDFNANGLTGPEFDEGRFMAVVRNVLDSQKGGTAGGSFGLGWATFPSSSQFGLVLCNSTLSIAESGKTDDRFIGVIDLPWHSIEEREYAGRGWYGTEDPSDTDDGPKRTTSYWGNDALTRDLYLRREDRRPGTSFLVVGAYDASGEVEEIEDVAERFSQSLADNFWPAMVDGPDEPARLQVVVRAERNGKPILENYVDPARHQPAKVAAFQRHLNDDVVEALSEAGEVVRRDVTLQVPKRTNEPTHSRYEHEAVLLVAQASDEDDDSRSATKPGAITYLRGSRMVIQSPRVGALPIGARPFHAIVLAGEAGGSAPADLAADRFLRAAEPPAHNKWTGTAEVTASYARGGKAAIDRFDSAVKKEIRTVIRQPNRDLSDGPESLKELIRIVPPTTSGKRPRIKSVRGHSIDEDGAWVISEATLALPARKDSRGWTVTPILRFGTESGSTIPVEWATLEPVERCELDEYGRLVAPASARTATFSAISDPASHPVGARRSKVLVDVRLHTDEV
ncbi:MAG: helix-turn-helix domain-containing protein [Acidimicrobiales bacterium]